MAKTRRARGSGSFDKVGEYFRWRIGIYDPVTKKTKYKSIKAKSRKLLEEKVAAWRRENKDNPAPPVGGKRLTVKDLVENFLTVVSATRQPCTVKNYEMAFTHLISRFGNEWVGKISSLDLQNYFLNMMKTHKISTVKRYKMDFSALFSFGVKHGLIARNPVSAVVLPRFQRHVINIPDEKDISAILSAAKSGEYMQRRKNDKARLYLIRRNYLIVLLGASCGLRLGEILGLTWPCVYEAAAQIDICHSMQDLPGARVLKCTKTGKTRVVALPDVVAVALKDWRDFSAAHAEKYMGFYANPLNLVFTSENGDPVCGANFTYNIFHAITTAAGVDSMHFHSLRHFAISFALSRGVPIPAVAEQAGHANIATTLNIYTHALQKSRDELKNMLDASPLFAS